MKQLNNKMRDLETNTYHKYKNLTLDCFVKYKCYDTYNILRQLKELKQSASAFDE